MIPAYQFHWKETYIYIQYCKKNIAGENSAIVVYNDQIISKGAIYNVYRKEFVVLEKFEKEIFHFGGPNSNIKLKEFKNNFAISYKHRVPDPKGEIIIVDTSTILIPKE